MNVICIAHTALSDEFLSQFDYVKDVGVCRQMRNPYVDDGRNQRAAIALTAIRTCYSPLPPTQILPREGAKYFGQSASDGEGGTESDRLFRHIMRSGHASTCEHVVYTFAVESVSRALLAQLTRHRQLSFSVQSQRYVKFGSNDRSHGFDYVTPRSLHGKHVNYNGGMSAEEVYESAMQSLQAHYDVLREAGVPAEDARMVLPQAATCNLVLTGNLRAILELYAKRNKSTHSQWEIADLAEAIRKEITKIDAWTQLFFDYYSQS
ncbi:FAD-dependent thymidylate synthase [Paenibacillus sp. YN15]|uniref:FAD-dependent thymidylate synthase n=1 Tax=Paenibacillus sp. YN15 TaxID=1742774 RepID=UPI000DCE143D|nr:FAD-dependent thymidylate synthase [Paenibacillus sp. YN15]RAU96818.1 FAD-dependent thymidylate synthase [Paenibacillus sp. YN15]